MSRTTWLYILLIAIGAGGLALTLSIGKGMRGVTDFSGLWRLESATQQFDVRVEQSGRYVAMHLPDRRLDLFVESDTGQTLTLTGEQNWTITPGGDRANFSLNGQSFSATRLESAPAATASAKDGSTPGIMLILLLQIVLIIGVSRIAGLIFVQIRQPQVMGEMLAGIMLGPSLFGWLLPGTAAMVFPPESIHYLGVLSQVGVIFFLFLIGLELDPKLLRHRGNTALLVSHASIVAPFILGAILTLFLYQRLFNDTERMSFASVALFMGAAMSITAFPVLARILTERNLHKTKVGAIAITAAAIDDVTAWCLLAFVVGIARADGIMPGIITFALSAIYVLFMFVAVKPFLVRLQLVHDRTGTLTQPMVALIFLLALASAYATEAIGIHALFGAFLMGAIMPKGTAFVRSIGDKLEDFTVVFLLPIFFAYTGLKTQIGLLNTSSLWFDTFIIILIACVGKFGGSALAGRFSGLSWREASAVGILMNTRGLMELVILNIGLQEGVITPAIFAMMVIMALVTTLMTTPILAGIYPIRLFGRDALAHRRAKLGGYTVLVPVALPDSGPAMARLAASLIGPPKAGGSILAVHLRRPNESQEYSGAVDEIDATNDPTLLPLIEQAREIKAEVEPISFITRDVASDIAHLASSRQVELVLMGFHKPVFGRTILGGTVHNVMSQCACDVGVFVDRGVEQLKRVLVPFLGNAHDRLALELVARMARSTEVAVTILHVVPPARAGAPAMLDTAGTVEKVFSDPLASSSVTVRTVEDNSPVSAVLREAGAFDLIVLGVSEEWGLESRLFGWRAERVAKESATSLLIVRKFVPALSNPGA